MSVPISRRRFLARAAGATAVAGFSLPLNSPAAAPARSGEAEFRGVDFHVHLDNSTINKVLELSRERGVKFGIVEHAGTKENQYPTILSNDDELRRYLAMLEGRPVFKGIQAEWTDWMGCFSRQTLAQLDYVLTDAMTFPGKDGQRVKLWTPEAAQKVDLADKQAFMDRYVDWHVEIMAREPIDILANLTWLPGDMLEQWERYWTAPRMKKVINAAAGIWRCPRNQFQLQTAAPAVPDPGQGRGCKVLVRIEWPVPEHGKARLLAPDGQSDRLEARGHVCPGWKRSESRSAAKVLSLARARSAISCNHPGENPIARARRSSRAPWLGRTRRGKGAG